MASTLSKTSDRQRCAATVSEISRTLLLLQVAAEGDHVVEHPPGLVLRRPQAGAGEQLVAVPAALGHLGVHPQPGARVGRDQLQLVDVEPQLVQPVDPLGDPVALLVGPEQLLAGELGPQRVVAARQVGGHRDRVHVVRQQPAGLQVEQFAADPFGGERDVVVALPVGQCGVQGRGLGVHQVGADPSGVGPEERVGQRAVAPEQPGQVQPHQQLDHGVEQLVGRAQGVAVREHVAVGHRVVEVPGDQHRVLRDPVHRWPLDTHPEHRDRRHPLRLQLPEQPVLPAGQPFVDLLAGEDHPVGLDEPHDVARQAALRHLDDVLVPPPLERRVPRQLQQTGRVLGGWAKDEAHASRVSGCGTDRERSATDVTCPGLLALIAVRHRPARSGDRSATPYLLRHPGVIWLVEDSAVTHSGRCGQGHLLG
jgi:hypothetical protein